MDKKEKKENKFLKGMSKSRAKPIREALQIQKGLIKSKQKLVDFKEPLALLIRRNNVIEFFEEATKGTFDFIHTNGDTRRIELTPSKILNFPYADKRVRTYILHEDYPLPVPDNEPAVSSELIAISQEKSMHDINKFRLKEAIVKAGATKSILIGVAIVVGVVAVSLTVVPQAFWDKVFEKGAETAVQSGTNASKPLLGMMFPFIWKKE